MTLLEYVAERLMGSPVWRSNGRSTWHCPFHVDANPSFCTLPPKAGCKDRFRCFGCGAWGDEYDLLKLFYSNENFTKRLVRLDAWRREFNCNVKPCDDISHRGRGREVTMIPSPKYRDDPKDVALAWANLMDDFRVEETSLPFALQILTEAVERCEACNVSVSALVEYWQDYEDWLVDSDQRHLAECDDPDCEAIVCRTARGLPPLTREELEAGRREAEERKRVGRAKRNVPKPSTSRRPGLSPRTKR